VTHTVVDRRTVIKDEGDSLGVRSSAGQVPGHPAAGHPHRDRRNALLVRRSL